MFILYYLYSNISRQFCSAKMSRQVIEQDTLGYKEWAEYKVHENVCVKCYNKVVTEVANKI